MSCYYMCCSIRNLYTSTFSNQQKTCSACGLATQDLAPHPEEKKVEKNAPQKIPFLRNFQHIWVFPKIGVPPNHPF